MTKSFLWTVFWLLALFIVPAAPIALIWVTVSSGYHIRVLDYEYDPDTETVTLTRNVMGDNDTVVRSYVTVTGSDGHACYHRAERVYAPFDELGNPKTWDMFPVPADLKPCLDKAPYTLVGRFNTFISILPLKPTWYFEPPRD
jgi:hypothetical protein